MLKIPPILTKKREKSDMEDLEVLGHIAFDLKINKDEAIKKAFMSLVGKLGRKEFLEEYSDLYTHILKISEEARKSTSMDLTGIGAESLPCSNFLLYTDHEAITDADSPMLQMIETSEQVDNKFWW